VFSKRLFTKAGEKGRPSLHGRKGKKYKASSEISFSLLYGDIYQPLRGRKKGKETFSRKFLGGEYLGNLYEREIPQDLSWSHFKSGNSFD